MAIDFGGEEDLPKASKEAGYKISVNSPEGMAGVEDLTHDHLMEISAGVFMKFKHAYVVGGVDEKGVELLDPHGDVDASDEKLYSLGLVILLNDFYTHLAILEKELEASSYKGFSVDIRDKMEDSLSLLRDKQEKSNKEDRMIIEELRKNWRRLNNKDKLAEENSQLVGLRPKTAQNILGVLKENNEKLTKGNIGKGFKTLVGETIVGKQKNRL